MLRLECTQRGNFVKVEVFRKDDKAKPGTLIFTVEEFKEFKAGYIIWKGDIK